MHRQVAMMGCLESHTTPRIRVKDDFMSVLVSGLGEGDEVQMEADGLIEVYVLRSGLTPFPRKDLQFVRFKKVSGSSPKPTSVEIHRGS